MLWATDCGQRRIEGVSTKNIVCCCAHYALSIEVMLLARSGQHHQGLPLPFFSGIGLCNDLRSITLVLFQLNGLRIKLRSYCSSIEHNVFDLTIKSSAAFSSHLINILQVS